MKKVVFVAGLAIVICAVVLISRDKVQGNGSDQGSVSETRGTPPSTASTRNEDIFSLESESMQSMDDEVLSTPVKALIGKDGKLHNYPELLAAINELGYEIASADVATLMEMLNFPNDRFPEGMRPIEINAVKNDVLDKLLRQKSLPEGLGLQMVEMARNAENDPVWRDYCVQFMEPFYDRAVSEINSTTESAEERGGETSATSASSSAAGGENAFDELTAIHNAMFAALDERGSTLAGTALIGLENLSRTHDEFDRKIIIAKAAEIASDEMASTESRMTALRLAAMCEGNEGAVGAARSLAQTGETVLLRSAAIVTLGEIGTPDDRELLESYLLDGNKQIADAAQMALAKMDSRN
ncbi:MAG: HEAT repeat domain-containing protein [Kiritimatiellales bacterium]|nr:HEAT repeat domain-containing protein [Kiritimatiellales bacterium]